jgi:ankyrin repeat protein
LIKLGQKKYQIAQLDRCISLAMCSLDYGTNGRHEVALGLILCSNELNDLDINIATIWKSAEQHAGNNGNDININNTITSIDPNTELNEKRVHGSKQLSNAIITSNDHAIDQIINAYSESDSFDVDFVDPKHGFPLLSLAIMYNYTKLAIELINRGANPLICNRIGRNVLFIVIEKGVIEVLKHIVLMNPDIELNIPVTTEDHCNYYPIHVAAKFNRGHLISYFSNLNVNMNQLEKQFGYTPLLIALVLGHEWAVFELMKEGADIHIPTEKGRTALYVVAEKGHVEVLFFMITRYQIDVNAVVDLITGNRLLYIASLYDKSHIISLLISHNVEVNYVNDNVPFTPLMVCIMRKNVIGTLSLLKAGADVHVINIGRNLMFVLYYYYYYLFI